MIATTEDAETWRLGPKTVVAASGGFEANRDWFRREWGAAADNFVVRGTRYNDGELLASLIDAGAAIRGTTNFHSVAVDARSPKFDGGIVTRIDSIQFGVVVNRSGARCFDEGEDNWPKR